MVCITWNFKRKLLEVKGMKKIIITNVIQKYLLTSCTYTYECLYQCFYTDLQALGLNCFSVCTVCGVTGWWIAVHVSVNILHVKYGKQLEDVKIHYSILIIFFRNVLLNILLESESIFKKLILCKSVYTKYSIGVNIIKLRKDLFFSHFLLQSFSPYDDYGLWYGILYSYMISAYDVSIYGALNSLYNTVRIVNFHINQDIHVYHITVYQCIFLCCSSSVVDILPFLITPFTMKIVLGLIRLLVSVNPSSVVPQTQSPKITIMI